MKALVTGANSLVGSHIVNALREENHPVRAFVRKTSDCRALEGLGAEIVHGDVLEPYTLDEAFRGCDTVFHAAAKYSYSPRDTEGLERLSRRGTNNVIDSAKRRKVKRVVVTSSSVTLGASTEPRVIDESRPVRGANPGRYIMSKIAQEKLALEAGSRLGVNVLCACPTICVGPNDYRLSESNAVFVNYLQDPMKATWPGGCNIVSAADVGRGHVLLARKGRAGERYVLGSENLYWSTVHSIMSELCGIDGPRVVASHTFCYLAGIAQELSSMVTRKRPFVTREQANMVGMYYWYSSGKARGLGYDPMPSRTALVKALSWLVASEHVSREQRATMTLSDEIYSQRS